MTVMIFESSGATRRQRHTTPARALRELERLQAKRLGNAAFLERLAASERCRRLVLGPLPLEAAVADLTSREVPEEVAHRVWRLAGGNPGLMHCLLDHWHSGSPLESVASEGPPLLVGRLQERFRQLSEQASTIVRALVHLGGTSELNGLVEASGLPRLVVQSRLRELSRKHGWIRMCGQSAELTQPFLGAVVKDSRD